MVRRLAVVTVRDLSRRPGAVLDRVARGERLIVARHGRPVATLQPLDGLVVQPVAGRDTDVAGSPLGDPEAELDKLSEVQRSLLVDGVWNERILPIRLSSRYDMRDANEALHGLGTRGLARRTARGWVCTGRGHILREALLAGVGAAEASTWRFPGKPPPLPL